MFPQTRSKVCIEATGSERRTILQPVVVHGDCCAARQYGAHVNRNRRDVERNQAKWSGTGCVWAARACTPGFWRGHLHHGHRTPPARGQAPDCRREPQRNYLARKETPSSSRMRMDMSAVESGVANVTRVCATTNGREAFQRMRHNIGGSGLLQRLISALWIRASRREDR